MTAPPPNPELAGIIFKLAIIESVLIGLGLVAFFLWGTVWGIVVAALIGSILFSTVVIRQALAAKQNDKR